MFNAFTHSLKDKSLAELPKRTAPLHGSLVAYLSLPA